MFRLGYNKYMEELGIKPNEYPFDNAKNNKYNKETGFNDYCTYSLNYSMVLFVYCYLRRLQEESSSYVDWEYHENNGEFCFEECFKGLRIYLKKDNDITEDELKEFEKSWNYIGTHISYIWS